VPNYNANKDKIGISYVSSFLRQKKEKKNNVMRPIIMQARIKLVFHMYLLFLDPLKNMKFVHFFTLDKKPLTFNYFTLKN
jgi:hypothetical protein